MEETVRRLSPLSFAQQTEDRLARVTELLRGIKARYARCSESCYSAPAVPYSQWRDVRSGCLQPCTQLHTRFFQAFTSVYAPANAQAKHCVFRCQTEHTQSHEGEEDLRSCQEQCYELLLAQVVAAESSLLRLYEQEFAEKYSSPSSCLLRPSAEGCAAGRTSWAPLAAPPAQSSPRRPSLCRRTVG